MAESLAPTAALNVAPGKRIGILSPHSRPNSTRSRGVCFTNYVMEFALLRRALPAGDDRLKRMRLAPAGAELAFEDPADGELGHPRPHPLDRALERLLRDAGGVADVGDLRGVFSFPQRFHEIHGGAPLQPRPALHRLRAPPGIPVR